jgi:cell division protein ZapA
MEALIPVNILIGDRNYRLKVKPEDEEKLRKTVKIINQKIIEYKTNFAGKDMQDYVAMVLIWLATEESENTFTGFKAEELKAKIQSLQTQIEQAIK